MRSFLPAALALAVSAIQAALVAEDIPSIQPVSAEAIEPNHPTDNNFDAAKILRVVIPKDGKLDRAEVEFEFTDGQAVSALVGQPIDPQWRLEKVEWTDEGNAAVATLRSGEVRRELRAGGELIMPADAPRPERPLVEMKSYLFEVPALGARRVRRALEVTPGEDRTPFEMLDRALDAGVPAQVLTPAQFDALSKFLSGCRDVNRFNPPPVTTKSGQRAVIEVIREFRYPVEWTDAPSGKKPPQPTAFETRNCGITLEIEPNIVHGPLLALDLIPQVVELLGAADRDKGTPIPYHNRARQLPDRALSLNGKMPFTVDRPARYVFSGRKEQARINLPPGSGVLLADFREREDIAPFQRTAPKGQLIMLVKAEMFGR